MLYYKLNFTFHCAILNTKVQQLRNKNHRLEEGDCIWQGVTNLAAKSGQGGPLFARTTVGMTVRIPPVASQVKCFSLPLLSLGDQPLAERAWR